MNAKKLLKKISRQTFVISGFKIHFVLKYLFFKTLAKHSSPSTELLLHYKKGCVKCQYYWCAQR